MRWGVLFVVVAAIAAVLTWGLARESVACGLYSLTVRIESSTPPQKVWCEAISRSSHSELLQQSKWPVSQSLGMTLAHPFAGTPLTVGVPCSERESLRGLIVKRTQFSYLFVRAGQEQHRVVEIPDKQVSRR